jgi:hypothetical protein
MIHYRTSTMQPQLDKPFTIEDLDALEHFLAEVAPDESMLIDELHGFLAAVVCSPQMIMPSEWMPYVWGGTEPEFETMEQAQEVMGQIMRLNNDVSEKLSMGDFDPLPGTQSKRWRHPPVQPRGSTGLGVSHIASHRLTVPRKIPLTPTFPHTKPPPPLFPVQTFSDPPFYGWAVRSGE